MANIKITYLSLTDVATNVFKLQMIQSETVKQKQFYLKTD